MNVIIAILGAVGALAGPFATLITALWNDAQGVFSSGTASASADELATEALALVPKVAALVSGTQAQIAVISQALQEAHSDLTVVSATHLATAAVAAAPVKTA